MNIRNIRQTEFANIWLNSDRKGILYLAPRFGKCSVGITIFNSLNPSSILIIFPDGKIKQSWLDEFDRLSYSHPNIIFTTYLSLHKYKDVKFDMIVLDEVHLMSETQIITCQLLFKTNTTIPILALTGTLAKDTRALLMASLGLRVIAEYSIEQAIKEGVIADYEISVVTIPLDTRMKVYNGKTEKQKFDNLSWVIDKFQREGKETFFLRLQRMRIIQNSVAKRQKTISLLKEYNQQRVLVFCGLIKVADSLQIPSYHSKSSEKNIFEDFMNGTIPHLAVVRIGNSGLTYRPLNRVIINYTDGNPETLTQKINRATSMEYDNPGKKALITIVSTNEDVELNWIKKGLSFFSKEKIKYL